MVERVLLLLGTWCVLVLQGILVAVWIAQVGAWGMVGLGLKGLVSRRRALVKGTFLAHSLEHRILNEA